MSKVRKIYYDDRVSRGHTWFKAVFLLPSWGMPLVPIAGFLLSGMPEPVFQAGYLFIVFGGLAYFSEDLLKRTIKVKDDEIFFGYRRFRLSELQSISLQYKKEQVVPHSATLEFGDARRLKLYVSRLKWSEFEDLLRYIENKVPSSVIDPVLLTLMKCKKAAGKSMTEIRDSISVPYNSRRSIKELAESFMETAEQWGKSGPILASFLALPFWIMSVTALYLLPKAAENISPHKFGPNELLMDWAGKMYVKLGEGLRFAGDATFSGLSNPIALALIITALMCAFWWLLRIVSRPNLLVMNDKTLSLFFNLPWFSIPVCRADLAEIREAKLVVPTNNSGPDHWILRLQRHNKSPVDLSLGAITSENKQRILKALEKWAPHVVMDAELTEALLPRQERSYTELWLQSLTSAPERRSLEPLAPGQELQEGRYQVIRCLGVGGQGTAYLCKDKSLMMERLNSYVVLKETIFPVFVDTAVRQQALERFEKEARLLSTFNSDGIVKLSDYFLEDHRGYLVLEHIDGLNLRQLVAEQGKRSAEEVRKLARQMCDILTDLHANGIVHRDFTPDNMILSKDGKLKLIDFNVAHETESGSTGTIVGKHAFLPPEQFRGKATFASDIYAMGATLFYLLTGTDPEPISQSSPKEVLPECDEALDELIRKATYLDSKKRFANIDEMRVAIEMEAQAESAVYSDETFELESGIISTTVQQPEPVVVAVKAEESEVV